MGKSRAGTFLEIALPGFGSEQKAKIVITPMAVEKPPLLKTGPAEG
jgi:hypothetical protein